MIVEKTYDELMEALEKDASRAQKRRKKKGWRKCIVCGVYKKCQKNKVCLSCNRRVVTPKARARLG